MPMFSKWGLHADLWEDGQDPMDPDPNKPYRFGPGMQFENDCNCAAYTGFFAPQKILKPAKEGVDLTIKLWHWESRNDWDPTKVGWCLGMMNLYGDDWKSVFGGVALSGAGGMFDNTLAGVDPQIASVNSDGRISWKLWDDFMGEYITFEPDALQFAMAYQSVIAPPPTATTIWQAFDLMRTDFRHVYYKNGAIATDGGASLRDFYDTERDTPQGIMMCIWRMRAGGGGVLLDGGADWDGDGVADFDTMDGMFDPIFLGTEMEFL